MWKGKYKILRFSNMMNVKSIKRKQRVTSNVIDITQALEIISAVRMKKSQSIVKNCSKFINACFVILSSLMSNLKDAGNLKFLKKTEVKNSKTCFLVISSDKGLCGAFNGNIFKKFLEFLDKNNYRKSDISIITVGKYGFKFLKRREFNIIGHFEKFHDVVLSSDIVPIYEEVFKKYEKGEFNKLFIVYSDFISSLKSQVSIKQILPTNYEDITAIIKEINPSFSSVLDTKKTSINKLYIYEPNPQKVLQSLTPFLLQIQIFYSITESNATEHSLRMMAMRNANDNATSFLKELTLMYNKLRQEKITSELIEITSAKEVM